MSKYKAFMMLLALVLALGMSSLHPAVASAYQGPWTGYAFGSSGGCCGYGVFQGSYAAHDYTRCPGDPAAYWPLGIYIGAQSPSSVVLYDQYGGAGYYTQFENTDIGDFNCIRANYWADIYFGRYKPPSDPCSCNNGQEYCTSGIRNNCNDATYFGIVTYAYQCFYPDGSAC